jgi:hypothetical protein
MYVCVCVSKLNKAATNKITTDTNKKNKTHTKTQHQTTNTTRTKNKTTKHNTHKYKTYKHKHQTTTTQTWYVAANLLPSDILNTIDKNTINIGKLLKRLMQIKGYKWNNYSIDLI